MKRNVLKEKSLSFAIRIVKLYRYLCNTKKETVLSKQVLRSGTSVGAMVCEAEFSETKRDFVHKLAIAQKEINETLYWLELLLATEYINTTEYENINNDAIEIIKLLTSIIRSAKNNIENTTI